MISIRDEDFKRLQEIADTTQLVAPRAHKLTTEILEGIAELMQPAPHIAPRIAPVRPIVTPCGHCEDCVGATVRAVGGYSCREASK